MKLAQLACIVGLVVLAAGEVLVAPSSVDSLSLNVSNINFGIGKPGTAGDDDPDDSDPPSSPGYDEELASDFLWGTCYCRGAKLFVAMTQNPDQAQNFITPINSPWDGTMYTELTTWGGNDVSSDPTRVIRCDFSANGRDMQTAFDALGIDTRSSLAGGSNVCFTLEHCNGPTVKTRGK
jgi:hypothetical protein